VAETVCFVVGARPNFVKTAPLVNALGKVEPTLGILLVHTGQHYDPELSDVLFGEVGLPPPEVRLDAGSGTHAEQTARALVGVERTLLEHRPACVVVAGDVNSTLAAALAAAKLRIPVVHLEAGLRSFDDSMPEEHNRRLTDHLSSLLLAHSESAVDNLDREGIDLASVHLVGNTMIDSLLQHADRAWATEPWREHGLHPHGYGLVTLHRPALVDDPVLLGETVARLARLSEELPLVFPAHPRTARRLEALGPPPAGSRLIVTPPLGYLAFVGLEAAARFVLTDSGGVQEETSALDIPCFTLRETTERPVTVELGTNVVLGLRPERIAEIPALLARPKAAQPIPLWDGRAGERAAVAILEALG
jgi:UDP-N-acetylglucosamine 2-epimerase (non-hydrolysing)